MKNKVWHGITKNKNIFSIYGISNSDEKIVCTSMQLEGEAHIQYMWWKKSRYSINWNKFIDEFLNYYLVSKKNIFSQNLVGCNKEETWMNLYVNGKHSLQEYLDCQWND